MRPTRRRSGAIALLIALACVLLGPAVVAAQDAESASAETSVDIRQIDTNADNGNQPSIRVFTGLDASPELSLAVNGEDATVGQSRSIADGAISARTVIVLDTGEVNADSLDELKTAATNYVSNRASDEQIAIITTGARPKTILNYSSSNSSLIGAIDRVNANGSQFLWDSLFSAGESLETQAANGHFTSVLLFAAGGDDGSTARPDEVQGILRNAQALLHVAAINVRDFNGPELDRIVLSSGGTYFTERESADFLTVANNLPSIVHGVHDVAFQSESLLRGNEMVVTLDGASRRVAYAQNSVTLPGALDPPVRSEPSKYALLTGNSAVYLGVAVAAIAVALATWSVGSLFNKDESGLNTMLSAYDGTKQGVDPEEASIANSIIFQRAVELTENIAERQGFLATTEQRLEQADVPLKAAESLMLWAGFAIVFTGLGFLMFGGLIGLGVSAAIGAIVPHYVLKFLAARRKKKFVAMLPETLQLLAGTLKAGYSFVQGLESVSREAEDPIAGELRKIVTEAQLGLPLEEAMDMSAERIGSDDWAWAIMAVKIQREVGGNLAELLMTVSDTMVARERLRRDVLALTAEGRISAIVLGALPILLGVAMYFMNPAYISQLWNENLGLVFLGMGIVSALIGFAWMKKTIEIEI